MKLSIPIEQVKKGDIISGKSVTEVLHRFDVMVKKWYVRAILAGGWPIIDGFFGTKMVEVERK